MAQLAIHPTPASFGPVLAARVGGKPLPLDDPAAEGAAPIHLSDPEGLRIYQRSVIFLLCKAASELMPKAQVVIEHSLSNGLYGELRDRQLTPRAVELLAARMRKLAAARLPIEQREMPWPQARALFERHHREDLLRLYAHTRPSAIPVQCCDGYIDALDGVVVPNTGLIERFRLMSYLPGFILQTPDARHGLEIPPYQEQPRLAETHLEAERWGEILGVPDVGSLNELIAANESAELIRVAEALHEKKIAQIADRLAQNEQIRLVLIAGPSSSGKTTFAQRLRTQLRASGLKPVTLSLDDYFLDRELTPLDEEGHYDYEAIEALDLPLVNQHLAELIQGEAVTLPRFNFVTGKREAQGRVLRLEPHQPLIVEGIHALNERLSAAVPKRHKFKIHVSALTQLNVSDHVRIPTRDVRLCRRLVRDFQFRGASAERTFELWPRVLRGEDRNIFPYQEEADVMFNSALPFELAVLKAPTERLLADIGPDSPYALEVDRLRRLLAHFLPLSPADVPANSILREFIGGSCYPVT